jgi:hypothetical protein
MSSRKGGGQPGNKNAEKHGFFSSTFSLGERMRLARNDSSLEAEIKATRVVAYRILFRLSKGKLTPEGTDELNEKTLQNINTFLNAMSQLSTLTRSFQIATGKYKPAETAILDALAELNAEENIK